MSELKSIFMLIPQAIEKIGAIGKDGTNTHQNYKFRSIDDMYNKIQPVLPELGLFFIPNVIDTKEEIFESIKKTQYGEQTSRSIRVKQRIKYMICASDGSYIESTVEGEAIDTSDKATNKAMTAAFKYMLIQVFCIAITDAEDADKESPEIPVKKTMAKTDFKKVEKKTEVKLNPVIQPEEVANTAIEKEQSHIVNVKEEVKEPERFPKKEQILISKEEAEFLFQTGYKFGHTRENILHFIYQLTKKVRLSELNKLEFDTVLQYLADNRKA